MLFRFLMAHSKYWPYNVAHGKIPGFWGTYTAGYKIRYFQQQPKPCLDGHITPICVIISSVNCRRYFMRSDRTFLKRSRYFWLIQLSMCSRRACEIINISLKNLKVLQPEEKLLACGDLGVGAMASIDKIIETSKQLLSLWDILCRSLFFNDPICIFCLNET